MTHRHEKHTPNLSGVYMITNTATGMKYIGSSTAIQARWNSHLLQLKNGSHACPKMLQDCQKYGLQSLTFRILELTNDLKELETKEVEWIQKQGAKTIYNRKTSQGKPKRTLVSVHQDTKEQLQSLGYRSINDAIIHLLDEAL